MLSSMLTRGSGSSEELVQAHDPVRMSSKTKKTTKECILIIHALHKKEREYTCTLACKYLSIPRTSPGLSFRPGKSRFAKRHLNVLLGSES